MYKLVIGNKNYSSWSLRAWLYLKESDIAFEEIKIALFSQYWREELESYTPAGKVPVLIDDNISVWDSMAIMEYVLENNPNAVGWPTSHHARARARSVTAEMHSGFMAVRNELPQNIRTKNPLDQKDLSDDCLNQIARIREIWTSCRKEFGQGGPWLFGKFSIADVMYAPVAFRFDTYAIPLDPVSETYMKEILRLESVKLWRKAAEAEPEKLEFVDLLLPANQTPLAPG